MGIREALKKKGYPLGDYLLRASNDELEAYLEGASIPSAEEWAKIREELSNLGLSGILEKPEVKNGKIVVARGKPPTPGEDGRLELLVDLSHGPREVDKNRIDFREMNLVVSVKAGTPIIRHIPPKPGQPGCNIWGEVIPPPPVKDVSFNYGEGLRPDEKNEILIAERDGCLIEKQGKLNLVPTYTLEGDVDWKSGNIRFYGEKLVVTGGVKRGFKVLAEGDVEIGGGVEDGTEIKVDGDLSVGGLIHGENTFVEISGKAIIKAIEYATVKVKGSLTVKDYILQARVKVGKNLSVIEGRGLLAAGEVEVGEGAVIKVVGNESFMPTYIKVGHPSEIFEEIEKLKAELLLLDETTEKLRKAMLLGLKLKKEGKLTPEKFRILQKIQAVFREKMFEQADLQEKIKQKEEELLSYQNYTLQVLEKVYPGVRVFIGRNKYEVKSEISGPGEFYLEDQKIKFRLLSTSR
ncbi:DUF342 domain-containing protein [Thermosulfurimonas dismutans]|uniref:Flagellar Assembly Protein A N-terminal region domain-containing protein n=1 Tax=Thermosulfurimonas dismutans TaxID=999894 RepID=A0A179D683_9BACT|nr:FapA family protein [Thermosulfurimonas dismutans]OAQ21610.1 hypothetical protein TDIS_0128 [Thermosulfurimonas dismutans]